MKLKPTHKDKSTSDPLFFSQYEILVKTTSDISSWRHKSNMFYISTNTAILGIAVFIKDTLPATVVLCIAGLAMALLWRQSVQSYKRINSAKFAVLLEMERKLPYPIFAKEKEYYNKEKHTELTITESNVPLVFIIAYLLALVYFIYPYFPNMVSLLQQIL